MKARDQFGVCGDRAGAENGRDMLSDVPVNLGAPQQPSFAPEAPWEAELPFQSVGQQADSDNAPCIQRLTGKRWREQGLRNLACGIADLNDVSSQHAPHI